MRREGDSTVWILTEGSRSRGFGHVVRCRAIADALREASVDTRFVLEGDETVDRIVDGFPVTRRSWIHDPALLAPMIGTGATVIVDALEISQHACEVVESTFARTAFIDDYQRLAYRRSLVIDWTIGAERDPAYVHREAQPGVQYLLGATYAALRREFWSVPSRNTAPAIGEFLLIFGGSDIRSLSLRMLAFIQERYRDAAVTVIVGQGCMNVGAIRAAGDNRAQVLHAPPTSTIVEAMRRADVAISGGGQTLYELARVGTPAVAIHVIDNQRFDVEGWASAGTIQVAGSWDDPRLEARVAQCIDHMSTSAARSEMSRRGRAIVDGSGARRICDHLIPGGAT